MIEKPLEISGFTVLWLLLRKSVHFGFGLETTTLLTTVGVDGAVAGALDHGAAALFVAQRRRHLGEGAVVADGGLVEGEMMWRRLRRYGQAALLGPAHRVARLQGRNMCDVIAPAVDFGYAVIARGSCRDLVLVSFSSVPLTNSCSL